MKNPKSIALKTQIFSSFLLFSHLAFASQLPKEKAPLLTFAFSWFGEKNAFRAGDVATVKVRPLTDSGGDAKLFLGRHSVRFELSVNGERGNGSCISGVSSSFNADYSDWNITFVPILAGQFSLLVAENHYGVSDLTLHFDVMPGYIYPSASVVSWMKLVSEFVAGSKANILILPRDAFGNNISSEYGGESLCNFIVSASYENGSVANLADIKYMGWNEYGYLGIEFVVSAAGSLTLCVQCENQTLLSSPLSFNVKPGKLDVTNCLGKWKYETNSLQIFSKLEFFIYQKDHYGNLVSDFYDFDARVIQKETNLSVPIADLLFQEMVQGIQLLSFTVSEPGDFMLIVFDAKKNESISNSPYEYTVFVGYCDGLNSVVNGSGLASSDAGQISYFSVYLEDMYHNTAPVEPDRLHVKIMRRDGAFSIRADVTPMGMSYGRRPVPGHVDVARSPGGIVPAMLVKPKDDPSQRMRGQSSAFNIFYTPVKSGSYELWVFCGNIALNNGQPFPLEVSPGGVDMSSSAVVKYAAQVQRNFKNEIVVQLKDSFFNPISLQQASLSLDITPANTSSFLKSKFTDEKDGLYIVYYLLKDAGAYNISIYFDDWHLSPCPLEINVYEREYFPEAHSDTVSVWEDESVSFDVLGNDYFKGELSSFTASSKPQFGSLLQYGKLFRYTPYKGFFGNDYFSYILSDINNNTATSTCIVSVLSIPPQFVSLPGLLQVTEDVLKPRFGGFPGFEIKYSDNFENISVTLAAQSGAILLAPMPLQFSLLRSTIFSVSNGGGKDLMLMGDFEVINSALQYMQYLGSENFYGNDVVTISGTNKNGVREAYVPIFVEPVNDPPLLNVPEYIILEKKISKNGLWIIETPKNVEFSIGDPDLLHFPGRNSDFAVTLTMEVNVGVLITNLPVDFIKSTEVKLENSYHWQPLQTFVTISNHFFVKVKGIRFHGTIQDSNSALQKLLYQGSDYGAVLTISVNDMGNYGCYPDCVERLSLPLSAEVNINLMLRRPMSSTAAYFLGSAIVLEFIITLILGGALLYFTCKCAIALREESRNHRRTETRPSGEDIIKEQNQSREITPEDVTYFASSSSPFSFQRQSSNFRQRSRKLSVTTSNKDENITSNDVPFIPLSIEKGRE